MTKILQRDAPEAIVALEIFEAGALRGEWQRQGEKVEYVISSYEDVIGYWTIPTEFTEGYWTIHWAAGMSATTLRHTRMLNKTIREWAHANVA